MSVKRILRAAAPVAAALLLLSGPVIPTPLAAPSKTSGGGDTAAAGRLHSGSLKRLQKLVETHRGRPLLINFWATWCAPCIEEIPVLREARERYADTGLVVLGVSLDGLSMESNRAARKKVRAWVERHGIPWETFYYEGDFEPISEEYDLPGPIPHSLIFDAEGTLRQSLVGVIPSDVLLRRIGEALEGEAAADPSAAAETE